MKNYLFTSESVSEGHPDKVADLISDAILDAILKQDPVARVAAETLTSTNLVVLAEKLQQQQKLIMSKLSEIRLNLLVMTILIMELIIKLVKC